MANHAPRGSEPPAAWTAVERLRDVRLHQMSFVRDLVHNWRGWTGSLMLHASIVLLLVLLTQAVVPQARDYVIMPAMLDTLKELDREPLPAFLPSPIEDEVEAQSSLLSDETHKSKGYNDLAPGPPDWITSGGGLLGPIGKGGGDDGVLGDWGPYVSRIRDSGLEVMFVFDSTGSMGGPIAEVRTRINQLVKVVTYLVPTARIGLVTYRDKKKYDLDDYEYTVKYLSLQKGDKPGVEKLQRFLRETEAYGGGDIPEAVYDGVEAAVKRSAWTPKARKIIIIFGDAPPRPEDNGLSKMYDLCRKWKDAGGVISCIDTTGASRLMDEFKQMAADGGGEATFLNDERAIVKQLVVFMFGSKWKEEIEIVYKEVLNNPEDTVVGE